MSGKQEKCKKPQTSQLKDYDYIHVYIYYLLLSIRRLTLIWLSFRNSHHLLYTSLDGGSLAWFYVIPQSFWTHSQKSESLQQQMKRGTNLTNTEQKNQTPLHRWVRLQSKVIMWGKKAASVKIRVGGTMSPWKRILKKSMNWTNPSFQNLFLKTLKRKTDWFLSSVELWFGPLLKGDWSFISACRRSRSLVHVHTRFLYAEPIKSAHSHWTVFEKKHLQ